MSTSSHILTQRTCGYQHASLPKPSTASSNHICNSPSCPFSKSASATISGVRVGMMIPGASNPFFLFHDAENLPQYHVGTMCGPEYFCPTMPLTSPGRSTPSLTSSKSTQSRIMDERWRSGNALQRKEWIPKRNGWCNYEWGIRGFAICRM